MGKGKLYSLYDNQFIVDVNYQLFNHPTATNWWGEVTLVDNVKLNEGDLFVIEFEDKRKSQCNLTKRVNRAVSGIPPRYVYHITGVSPLE